MKPPRTRRARWFGSSLIPLVLLLGLGGWYIYNVQISPPEFQALEGFQLENELILVSYLSLILAAASWWSMLSLYGKGAFSREHIWPSLFTVGALFTLSATVVLVYSVMASDDQLIVKVVGFLLAAVATLILCFRDHAQLMGKPRKK